jgi:hypothetical protein
VTVPEVTPRPDSAVEAAISRVLEAEAEALAAIEAARRDGAKLVAEASAAAEAVKARSERRIRALTIAFERALQKEIDDLDRKIAGLSVAAIEEATDQAAVSRAVALLAAALSGGADHG